MLNFRLFNDAVLTFHTSQEEVTLGVTKEVILLRNYNEETPGWAMVPGELAEIPTK